MLRPNDFAGNISNLIGLEKIAVNDFFRAEYRGTLVAGGQFLAANEDDWSGVAFWNGARWDSFAPGVSGGSIDGTVRCLAVYQDELWVGGDFTQLNGIDAGGLAHFDGTNWQYTTAPTGGSSCCKNCPRNLALYSLGYDWRQHCSSRPDF